MVTAVASPARPALEPRLVALLAPLAVFAIVVANAWSGLMPGVDFWDTGEFQTVLPLMGTAHPTGYPTYVLLGWLVNLLLTPIGEPAFRINVLSLLAVAVAAAATVGLVRRLTDSTVIGVAAGIGLATTPLVWQNATRADPHPLHLAFVALLLLALVTWERTGSDRWLVGAAVIFGLAAGNHSLTLLLVPPVALYVLAVEPTIWRRWRFAVGCVAAAFATMAVVYLELPLRGGLVPALTAPLVYAKPATWDGFWYIALAEQFRGSLSDPLANLGDKWDTLLDKVINPDFGLLAIVIPPAFVATVRRAPRYALLTGLAMVITVLFNMAYTNADITRYYLGPFLWIWTWLAILAADLALVIASVLAGFVERARHANLDDRAFGSAVAAVAVVLGVALLLPAISTLGDRRDAADRSAARGAQDWLNDVLPLIPQNAVLVSWWSTSTPLWYAQKVEGQRPDILIVDDRTMLDLDLGRAPDVINRYLGDRPVYVIRLPGRDTDELTAQYAMEPIVGSGYEVVWRVDGHLVLTQ